ncbi:hypothetical protein [Chryseobacterium soldanellicola]|nr:hypothetical protein [Chryseobacterium soldanellicola]
MELKEGKMPDLSSKTSFQWWKYVAIVVFLISLGGLFYFNSNQTEKNNIVAKNNHSKKSVKVKSNAEIINSDLNYTENNIIITSNENKTDEIRQDKKVIIISQKPLQMSNSVIAVKEKDIVNYFSQNPVIEEKITNSTLEKPVIVEREKTSYIKAEELLLGREFDKTREESHEHHKTFGILDMERIKIKSPNSFKILGVTVFSDSLETK